MEWDGSQLTVKSSGLGPAVLHGPMATDLDFACDLMGGLPTILQGGTERLQWFQAILPVVGRCVAFLCVLLAFAASWACCRRRRHSKPG